VNVLVNVNVNVHEIALLRSGLRNGRMTSKKLHGRCPGVLSAFTFTRTSTSTFTFTLKHYNALHNRLRLPLEARYRATGK
jgi:hypothetical protein